MTQATHTPGPWIARSSSGEGMAWLCDNQGKHFLNVRAVRQMPQSELLATTHLIAAAPAMLAALELCLDRGDIADCKLGDNIRAAIAKAKGVQS
jgi:aminoglycoside phosphotransferase